MNHEQNLLSTRRKASNFIFSIPPTLLIRNTQLLVVRLLSRDDRGVRRKHEMDARVRHKVGLELRNVHVECSIETQRRREGRNHLSKDAVEVGVSRPFDIEVPAADVI